MVNPASGCDSTLVDEFLSSGAANTRPMAAPTTSAQGHTLYNSGSEEEDLSGGNALVGSGAPGNLRGSLNSSPTSGGLADELSQPLLSRQASSQNAQGTNTTTNTNTAATGMNSSSGSTPIGLMAQQQQHSNNNNTVQEGGNVSGPLFLDPAGMTHVVALQRLFVLMIEAQEIITRLQQFGYFPGKQFMADDPSGAVQMLVSLMTASMQATTTNSTPANTMMGGGNEGGSGSNSPHRMASPNTLLSGVGLGGTQGNMNSAQLPAMPPPPGMSGMPSALQMNPLPCATSAPAALQQGGNAFFPFGTNTNNGRNSAAGAANPFFDMSGGNSNAAAAAGGGGMMNTTTAGGGTNEDGIGQDPNAMWAFPHAETNAATQPNQLDALLARAHEQQQQQRAGAYGMMNNYAKPGLMSMMGNHPGANTTHDEMGGKSGLDSPHFDANFMSSTGANAGGSGRNSHQNSSHSRHGRGSRNQRRNKGANGNNAGAEGQGMFGDEAGNEGNTNTAAAHNNNNNAGLNPAEAVLAAGGIMACVEFKRGRIRKYACDLPDITPGAYVLVDGDRGTDCGLLVQTARMLPDGMKSVTCMDGCDVKDEKLKLENGRVLRPASDDDIDRLHNIIANAEAVALKTCRQRCLELGIDIELVDVEYQFDMKKISFFFNCDHSVDFRALVRELYRTFGARIWMENINPKVKNAMPYPNEQNGAGQEGEGMTSGGGNNRGHHGGYRRRN